MAISDDDQKLISDVRVLTDFKQFALDDADLDSLIQLAKDDIVVETNIDTINWYDPDNLDARQALFWTTCVFTLLKARELDGADIRFENLDVETVRAAGSRYSGRPVMWYNKARRFRNKLITEDDNAYPYGAAYVKRENRVYGDTTAGGPEGS